MDMVLEFLGTGTSTGVPEAGCHCEVCTSSNPHDQRLRTSAWIQVDGKSILIDCGPDFRQQAIRAGIERIDALLITHGHYDHAGGLDDLRPYCKDRAFPIYLEPSVASDIRQRIPYCFSENRYPGVPEFRLHEIGLSPFEVEGIPIVPIRAMHYKLPIVGFRIYNLAYITDALYRICQTRRCGYISGECFAEEAAHIASDFAGCVANGRPAASATNISHSHEPSHGIGRNRTKRTPGIGDVGIRRASYYSVIYREPIQDAFVSSRKKEIEK